MDTLADLMARMRTLTGASMRVCMPARVVGYDHSRSMAQIQIVQPDVDPLGGTVAQPVINEVPVSWPRGGGAFLTMPLNVGDTGIAVFADADIGAWVSDNIAVADSERRHAINDAVFIPGVQGGGISANPDAVELGYAGSVLRILPSGNVEIDAPQVTFTGTIIAPEIIINGIPFTTHTHGGVQVGGGSTGVPQ